ncbi:MAG: acylphosphatase [Candidatus Muiribacteriota bacterium]
MYKAIQASIKGRVQGVGYRYFVFRNAKDLAVTGYVRNMPDRSVEVVAEGDEINIESLIEQLKIGPFSSKVEKVEVHYYNYSGNYNEFRITG